MLTLALRDNIGITAINKAGSVSALARHRLTLGTVVIYCLLLSTLVGKSHLLYLSNNVWRLHMATVAAIVTIGFIVCIRKRSQQWTYHHSREFPLRVKGCLAALLATGILSCLAQENGLHNLAFFAVFAGMVYIVFINGAVLTRGISKNRCIDLALLPLCIMVVGSLPFIVFDSRERLVGLYFGAVLAGQMFGLTCLLLFWKILYTQSQKVWIYWVLFVISTSCLVLTRTRTDIFGTPVGIIICLYAAMRSGVAASPRRRAWVILVILIVLILVISSTWLTQPEIDTSHAREYLRISGDYEDITRNRLVYWQTGMHNVSLWNIFGEGPLARFGGQLFIQESGYARDSNMHNTVLSVFQYYGWPGGILFIIFLVLVVATLIKRRDPYATLGLSLLTYGLVNSISENWLLSFGSTFDVYSWFILGMTLSHNSSSKVCEMNNSRYQNLADWRIQLCRSPYLFKR